MTKFFKLILLVVTSSYCLAHVEESAVMKWSEINESYFEFSLPSTFKKIEVHGEDSYVRKYQSRTITLNFDYGKYSNSLEKPVGAHEYKEWVEEINGRKAKIMTYKKSNTEFAISVHFAIGGRPYKSGNMLNMFSVCRSKNDYEVVERIYRSIAFIE